MVTPAAKRQAVAHLVANHEMGERRACRVIGCCRMTMRYELVRQDDPVLRDRLKELAEVRRRFGYRRLHVFLRREGHEVNHKRLFRIYREEQLHVRRRGGRKCIDPVKICSCYKGEGSDECDDGRQHQTVDREA